MSDRGYGWSRDVSLHTATQWREKHQFPDGVSFADNVKIKPDVQKLSRPETHVPYQSSATWATR